MLTLLEPGRRDRLLAEPLRRHAQPARHRVPALRHHARASSTRTTSTRCARAIGRAHAAALRRDDRQPAHRRARHRRLGADRARARAAADDRQHLRHALPVPPARARRAHRDPLGHEVHRRPRHLDRRRDRRRRHVPWEARALPRPHRAVGGLPRHALRRDVRQLRVHHEGARRDDARPRAGAVSPFNAFLFLQGLETLVAAHGPPLRQRARDRGASCARTRASPGCPTPTSPTRRTPPTRSATCRAGRARSWPSASRAGARRARRFIEALRALLAPRQRRRREDARDPPGARPRTAGSTTRRSPRPAWARTWCVSPSASRTWTT